jgi:hypothetical protein
MDEWFENVKWTGSSVEITAVKEASISGAFGVTVFAGDTEYTASMFTVISGSMRTVSGNAIIPAGATIGYTIDTGGASPDKIVVYLGSGEVLEKQI